MLGTARGGTGGLAVPAIPPGRDYDIFAGGAIAYAEADLGIVTAVCRVCLWLGAMGTRATDKLHGFQAQPFGESTQITSNGFLDHLDTSPAFAHAGLFVSGALGWGGNDPTRARPATRYAIGSAVRAGGGCGGLSECSHPNSNVFNSRLGTSSHAGLLTQLLEPGDAGDPGGAAGVTR